jgi:hypothetical protein
MPSPEEAIQYTVEHYLIGWKATYFETWHGDQAVKSWRMLNLFGRGDWNRYLIGWKAID